MAAGDASGGHASTSSVVKDGSLSALLRELASAPEGNAPEVVILAPGTDIGRFRLVRELGRGGFGQVWEARDTQLRRSVAFKVVRPGRSSELRKERLLHEAEAAARLSHPNIVMLHDVGLCDHGPYLVMELLRGRTLASRHADGAFSRRQALDIAVQVARGLAHAHARGVIHRDLKPANVFLCDDGLVKVLDLGLAHAFGRRRAVGGTPQYMAPEQWREAPEDERTDVFALGVIVYQMLTGEQPFPDDRGATLVSGTPPPMVSVPESAALGELVDRMLAFDPVARPRDAGEVLAALEACRREIDRDSSTSDRASSLRPRRRHRLPRALVLAAGVALGAAITSGVMLLGRGRAPDPPPDASPPVVVVADVANTTGDPELDVLSEVLAASLRQSRRLSVLGRSRAIELARDGNDGGDRVDAAVGREVARRAHAGMLVTLELARQGALYSIEAHGIEPVSGRRALSFFDRAEGKERLLPALDRLATWVRREMGESAADIETHQVTLRALTSGNLAAFGHWLRARALLDRYQLPEAVTELRQALAREPGLALAQFELARLGRDGEIGATERLDHEHAAQALEAALPLEQRLLLVASSAAAAGRDDEAAALYRRAVEEYPDDPDALRSLGAQLVTVDRPAEAAPVLARALRAAPLDARTWELLSRVLGFLGRTRELRAAAEQAARSAPGPETASMLAEASLWAGDLEDAIRRSRAAIELGQMEQMYTLVTALLRRGEYREIPMRSLRWAADRAGVELFRGHGRRALAILDETPLETGRWSSLLIAQRVVVRAGLGPSARLEAEARALARSDAPFRSTEAAVVAWAGEPQAAAKLGALLAPGSSNARLYRAVAAWRAGRLAEALPELRQLASRQVSASSMLGLYFLGEAALAAGRPDEAVEALQRYQRMIAAVPFQSWPYPRSLLLLGKAERARGRIDEARRSFVRLGYILGDADADFPLRREVDAELTALR